ncbi:MAG: hypothetical protein M9939_10990 [Mesorhizobium sp.]|nr:hypothetical protein [Mesorhizobium sp.]MCO5161654.1 hypothetical protein [Mesorhizobium sp.]
MGINIPRERVTFSIDANTRRKLEEAIPASQRSRYVEQAIEEALRKDALERFRTFLNELPKAAGGGNISEFLHRRRLELDGRPIEVLEGRNT